ncbi:hypothetical protein RchiOBHm_Chr2g0102391 [Rosa chinensis]|uniref:Uncharacterized protein n=1 Tax=Rosa chinensis TaxID=74649 RepID=A0A2P6RMN5_ROSCH|nr:hypothetical protein RchiOBHm_Chr2g0102391 [Rosa chinensis]
MLPHFQMPWVPIYMEFRISHWNNITARRKYTLERMFANQLLECAKDQLSFRAVTQISNAANCSHVINTNSWSGSGHVWPHWAIPNQYQR